MRGRPEWTRSRSPDMVASFHPLEAFINSVNPDENQPWRRAYSELEGPAEKQGIKDVEDRFSIRRQEKPPQNVAPAVKTAVYPIKIAAECLIIHPRRGEFQLESRARFLQPPLLILQTALSAQSLVKGRPGERRQGPPGGVGDMVPFQKIVGFPKDRGPVFIKAEHHGDIELDPGASEDFDISFKTLDLVEAFSN